MSKDGMGKEYWPGQERKVQKFKAQRLNRISHHLIDWSTFRWSAAVREASAAARCERAAAGLRHSRAPIRVESRCGAVSLESFRFHIPLVKPDGRFSRIRLSDKALRFSPTAGSQSAFPA